MATETYYSGPIRFEYLGNTRFFLGLAPKIHLLLASGVSPGTETGSWSLIEVGPTCGAQVGYRTERMRCVT